MSDRHVLIQTISKDHEMELMFAKRLSYGRPEGSDSKWPTNEDILEQVARAKEIFYNDLIYHFIIEEEVIFQEIRPLLKDSNGIRILDMLLEQHTHLKKLFGELEATSTPKDLLKVKLQDIGSILENHIHLEEGRLFPLINKEIPKDVLDTIWEKFQKKSKLEIK
ncbi:MAG: hemerythrin domain-containing protein, partial [Candidatus Kariarchaeaceae archaeon]